MPRYFTLAEARQRLKEVDLAIRGGIEAKRNLEAAEEEHRARIERIMFAGGMVVNQVGATQTRDKRDSSAAILKQVFAALEEVGCLVKDLDIGLIDFPALYRGREVYLCWRMGRAGHRFLASGGGGFCGAAGRSIAISRGSAGARGCRLLNGLVRFFVGAGRGSSSQEPLAHARGSEVQRNQWAVSEPRP